MSEKLTRTRSYDYSPIIDREPLKLPDGAWLAVVPYINIEHFPEDTPGTALIPATAEFTPDALNYGWRDYGNRVGLWRMMEIMDRSGYRGTVCLNSDIVRECPRIIEEGKKRNWAWIGHGLNNTSASFLGGKEEQQEREIIGTVLETMQQALGRKTKGWLGPFLCESFNTPDILAELGVEYLCDFTADDQPFEFNVKKGSLIAVPYTVELNDIPAILNIGVSGEQFGDMIIDQFDVLYEEGKTNARIMPICLHTFLSGQPFRAKHLDRALKYIAGHDKVWLTTGDEVNDWYRTHYM
ncbi:MAG: polysaccharide deacetylase family protein [Gammaproteobacteria bacterium]